MSPYPSASASTSSLPSATAVSRTNDATPDSDPRLLAAITVLGIVAAFLIAFIIWMTLRVKRREVNGGMHDLHGTVMHHDHPAAQITPFGAVGPNAGGSIPRFNHKPGQDMRIAIRRPDGAWHFADSRTPFAPSGISDIDVTPSPVSTSSLRVFPPLPRLPSTKEEEARASRYIHTHTDPPPPVYYREPCREHFDDFR